MSGVYIKGMEMPKRDHWFLITPSGNVYDADVGLALTPMFKAIPVPDHGRLGDLDALLKTAIYQQKHHDHTDGLAARHHIAEFSHFIGMIMDTPTIIPASKEDGE